MAADADDSYWDCWPTISQAGVQVSTLEARAIGLVLTQRERAWLASGQPTLQRRDYSTVQDDRTIRDYCVPGKSWLDHDHMVELFAPLTGPPDAGEEYWRQGSPVLKYLDWRAIAM
eukprot:4802422-Amphidinium_carterae.1